MNSTKLGHVYVSLVFNNQEILIVLRTAFAPLTIHRLEKLLPISSTIHIGESLNFFIDGLSVFEEYSVSQVEKGQITLNAAESIMKIHLTDRKIDEKETLLGYVINLDDIVFSDTSVPAILNYSIDKV